MSWGVATQNGVSVSLASIVSLSCGATEFSPASLFTSGVAGAWYDPSDYSTLFQDSAGTTPVTAVEQPVGLMLDKSQGLVLGSELVTNPGPYTTTTGWTPAVTTLSAVSGELKAVNNSAGVGRVEQSITTVIGKRYKLSASMRADAANITAASCRLNINTTTALIFYVTANGVQTNVTAYFEATSTSTTLSFQIASAGAAGASGDSIYVTTASVKEIAGNHASQATAASRPVLRARYNFLTYSEDFSNAVWSANAVTKTASTFTAENTSNAHAIFSNFSFVTGSAYTFSVRLTYVNNRYVSLRIYDSSQFPHAVFDLVNGTFVEYSGTGTLTNATITQVSPGVFDLFVSKTSVGTGTGNIGIFLVSPTWTSGSNPGASWLAAGTESVGATRAQLVTGSSAGTYQRIAAATDYATAGFLPYLALDGTDDSFGTNSINFTATDKVSLFAGITKNSDAATGMVLELSDSVNIGSFRFAAPFGGGATNLYFESLGTLRSAATGSPYAAPVTAVMTGLGDIPNDGSTLRVNGAVAATNTADQGTGSYGTYPLYIGRRNNSILPFNGRIYQLIVVGKAVSASELSATEAYVATKTGVTL